MSFINQRGNTYYALKGETKTGKPRYFASKKQSSDKGEQIEELPADFSFYESPASGVVTIRRRIASRVTVKERNLIERLCLEFVEPNCKVAIEKDSLVVYVATMGINSAPELRFTLESEHKREFSAERLQRLNRRLGCAL